MVERFKALNFPQTNRCCPRIESSIENNYAMFLYVHILWRVLTD